MGKPGGGTNTNTVLQQSSPPAQYLQAYQNLTNQAQQTASTPLTQYGGSLVSGFTPQQSLAFDETSQLQGQYAPYLNAAAQSFSQATQPLWPSLPQFNTAGLPQGATTAINAAQQYGAAAAQPIAQQLYPFTETAMGAAQGLTSNAAPYAALATQPIDTSRFTGFGLSQAQGVPGLAGGYAGNATTAAASAPGAISQFESPYTQQVTSALQNLFNQQNAQQLQQVRGSSVGAGAYGGDREAVAEALTAQQQQLAEAPALSQALQQGFQTSLGAAQQQAALEAQTGLGAGQLATQAGLGAGQLGVTAGQLGLQGQLGQGQLGLGAGQLITGAGAQQGQLALGAGGLLSQGLGTQGQLGLGAGQLNLAAGQGLFNEFNTQQQQQLAAEQANAWLSSQAGFGLSALGSEQQNLGLGGAQALLGTGGMQQQLAQEQLNIPYEQFLQQQAYPYQELGFLAPIVEGTGSQAGGTSSTSYPGASLASQLGGLGMAGIGTAGLLNSTGLGSTIGSWFGGGAGLGTNAALASSVAAAPFTADLGATEAATALSAGSPFLLGAPLGVAEGGRVGHQGGGLASATPGSGYVPPLDVSGSGLPHPPKIELDAIVPPGPAVKTGKGPPQAPQGGTTAPGTQSQAPAQEIQELEQGLKLAGLGKAPASARGGLVGMPHPHLGGGLADMAHLAKPAMGLHEGFQTGGDVSPLTAAAPLSGTSPNTQTFYQQLTQMPIEQLREMSVRVPPTTPQGQMVQRALAAKEMTPGAGTAAPMQPTGGLTSALPMQQQPQQPGMGLQGLPTASGLGGGIGGYADGGAIPEDPDADPHPIVDHSGKTVVIHYPSEGKSLDLGIPSMKAGMAAGGTADFGSFGPGFTDYGAVSNAALNDPTSAAWAANWGVPAQTAAAPGASQTAAVAPQLAQTTAAPAQQAATPAQQAVEGKALVGPPAANPGFNIPRPQATNPFANIQTPSAVNVGQATIPHPMTYNQFQPPQLNQSLFQPVNPFLNYSYAAPSLQPQPIPAGINTGIGLPQLPEISGGSGLSSLTPVAAHGGRIRLQDGGLADAAHEISDETNQILGEHATDPVLGGSGLLGTTTYPSIRLAPSVPPPRIDPGNDVDQRLREIPGAALPPAVAAPAAPPDLETTRAAPGTGGLASPPPAPDLETTRSPPGMGREPSAQTTASPPKAAAKPEFTEIPDYLHPLFHDIVGGESGGRDVLYGGKPVPPGNVIPGAVGPTGKPTHAFSEFQFEPDTWNAANAAAQQWGHAPLNKDDRADREWAALWVARRDYRRNTGGKDLDADAKAGNIDRSALAGTWTSLGQGGGGTGGTRTGLGGRQDTGDPVVKAGVLPPAQSGLAGAPDTAGLARIMGPRTTYQPGPGASPWMALIAAGLGTMAGRSPQALVNLGQGGLEGVKVLGQQEQEKMRQAQLANEAENRQATLGIEQQKLTQTGQYQQNEIGVRTQELQVRQQQVDRELLAANQRFEAEMARNLTADRRAQIIEQHYADIAQHQQSTDAINASYRAMLMAKPIPGRDPKTGELGNFVYSPEKGTFDFQPGATVGKAATSAFDAKRQAYIAVHKDEPGVELAALDFASGRGKPLSPEEISRSASTLAQRSVAEDATVGIMKPEEKQAREAQYKRFWEGQIRSGTPAPATGQQATPGAAPEAAAPKPSQADIDFVKAHPETKARFEDHFKIPAPVQ